MKDTVHLPRDLHRALKVRAAEEGASIQSLVEELLLDGLLRKHAERRRVKGAVASLVARRGREKAAR